ncbi:MAG: hypothetical protein CVV21_04215 [Candidatus Goldiibacteriota bacterium HGW-Goldbacteria-1]|nr:MAG: hypothetical protein CVV21_04215 [Candidatus Goldiibacteriota bacterium HGW-Goldbacteria-1]
MNKTLSSTSLLQKIILMCLFVFFISGCARITTETSAIKIAQKKLEDVKGNVFKGACKNYSLIKAQYDNDAKIWLVSYKCKDDTNKEIVILIHALDGYTEVSFKDWGLE